MGKAAGQGTLSYGEAQKWCRMLNKQGQEARGASRGQAKGGAQGGQVIVHVTAGGGSMAGATGLREASCDNTGVQGLMRWAA